MGEVDGFAGIEVRDGGGGGPVDLSRNLESAAHPLASVPRCSFSRSSLRLLPPVAEQLRSLAAEGVDPSRRVERCDRCRVLGAAVSGRLRDRRADRRSRWRSRARWRGHLDWQASCSVSSPGSQSASVRRKAATRASISAGRGSSPLGLGALYRPRRPCCVDRLPEDSGELARVGRGFRRPLPDDGRHRGSSPWSSGASRRFVFWMLFAGLLNRLVILDLLEGGSADAEPDESAAGPIQALFFSRRRAVLSRWAERSAGVVTCGSAAFATRRSTRDADDRRGFGDASHPLPTDSSPLT